MQAAEKGEGREKKRVGLSFSVSRSRLGRGRVLHSEWGPLEVPLLGHPTYSPGNPGNPLPSVPKGEGKGWGRGRQDEKDINSRVGAGASGCLDNLDQVTDGECELR